MTILVVFVSCSKLAEFLHVAFISVEKHHPVFFPAGLPGRKLTFFACSQLAPKYVKVVANSKKLVAIMTHTQKSTFHALINFHDKRDQNSPPRYKEDTRMGHIQC